MFGNGYDFEAAAQPLASGPGLGGWGLTLLFAAALVVPWLLVGAKNALGWLMLAFVLFFGWRYNAPVEVGFWAALPLGGFPFAMVFLVGWAIANATENNWDDGIFIVLQIAGFLVVLGLRELTSGWGPSGATCIWWASSIAWGLGFQPGLLASEYLLDRPMLRYGAVGLGWLALAFS